MSSKTLIIFCLIGFSCARQLQIGQSIPLLGNRIVGGNDAEKGEFPHQVSLQWGFPPVAALAHLCGGTIINETWILTAGHCVNAVPNYGKFVIKAGKQLIKSSEITEQTVPVAETFVHEKYIGNVAPFDIALLRLEIPLKFNRYVKPAKLPETEALPQGETVLSGWGSISTSNVAFMPDRLQKVSLPIIDLDTCKKSFEKLSGPAPLHETNICTGPLNGGLSACSGDSGGPLVLNKIQSYEIVGVVSWGITPCGIVGAPSVYVRVSAFVDWITNIINSSTFLVHK